MKNIARQDTKSLLDEERRLLTILDVAETSYMIEKILFTLSEIQTELNRRLEK